MTRSLSKGCPLHGALPTPPPEATVVTRFVAFTQQMRSLVGYLITAVLLKRTGQKARHLLSGTCFYPAPPLDRVRMSQGLGPPGPGHTVHSVLEQYAHFSPSFW